jgi:hypothetical protein
MTNELLSIDIKILKTEHSTIQHFKACSEIVKYYIHLVLKDQLKS